MWTVIWHSLVGLVMIGGLMLGGVVMLGKAIAQGAAHDVMVCNCYDCRSRRVLSYKKALERADQFKQKKTNYGWVSTEELRTQDVVMAKGSAYQVMELRGLSIGTAVHLRNVSTGVKSLVMVKPELSSTKMWAKRQ